MDNKLNIFLASPRINYNGYEYNAMLDNMFDIAVKQGADLIIFPEGLEEDFYWDDISEIEIIKKYKHIPIPIILGLWVCNNDEDCSDSAQLAIYYNPNAKGNDTIFKSYWKHSTSELIAFDLEGYKKEQQQMFKPIILNGYKIQVNICHDIFFPLITNKMSKEGMDILINLTGRNVNLNKWYNIFRGRSYEFDAPFLCTLSYDLEAIENKGKGKAEAFGFWNGSKLKPKIFQQTTKYQDGFALFDMCKLNIDKSFRQEQKEASKQSDNFKIGFNQPISKNKTHINLVVENNIIYCYGRGETKQREILSKWYSPSLTEKVIALPYKHLYDSSILQKEDFFYGKANHIVVYFSPQNVDIEKSLSLIKLRAIENRIAVVLFAPNFKAVVKTTMHKNIQYFEAKPIDIIGIDLLNLGGTLSLFHKDSKLGISKENQQEYFNL